jgi:hypothetical protein
VSERVVLVTGGRHYADRSAVAAALREARPDTVMHGGATGADALARDWCVANGRHHIAYPADWGRLGNAAGPVRNREMAERLAALRADGCEVLVLAFPGGDGTAGMIREATRRGLPVRLVGG